MILGRVRGDIVATVKHPAYAGRKLLIVERVSPQRVGTGTYIVAVDVAGAGIGETVLVMDEGNSARQILGGTDLPVRSVVVGIVDEVEVAGELLAEPAGTGAVGRSAKDRGRARQGRRARARDSVRGSP